MVGKFFKSLLIVLILISLATVVSGCPWDDDGDDPSPMSPVSVKPQPDPDDDDSTPKPKITPKPYEPRNA